MTTPNEIRSPKDCATASSEAVDVPRFVRQFVIQERYRSEPSAPDWFDDPDQPPHTEATPEAAIAWLVRDTKESEWHAHTYEHRLIERTERVYYTETDCDRVCLPRLVGGGDGRPFFLVNNQATKFPSESD